MRRHVHQLFIPTCVLLMGITSCAQPAVEAAGFSAEDAVAVEANIEAYRAADPISSPDEFFSQFSDDVFW